MIKAIYKLLNIESGEENAVVFLLIQSFFLGIFVGALDVAGNSIFLESFSSRAEVLLPRAFIISGLAGICMSLLYAKLQSFIKFSRLAVINLFLLSFFAFGERLLYGHISKEWLAFIILVMMGPMIIISMLGFWGGAARLFNLRQGKRLFSLVDAGQIFGIIISSYAVSVLARFGFKNINLLIIAGVSILSAMIIQLFINARFEIDGKVETTKQPTTKPANSISFAKLLKDPYLRVMTIFVALSMISAFFIYFSFLTISKYVYPKSEDLTEFLGAFMGTLMIFTFLIKTFVYSKILKTYNLLVGLMVLPIILLLFTLTAALVASFFGYRVNTSGFIIFFLLIALSRLFQKSLKDSIEAPSFKVLYQSLDIKIRFDVQAKVDGLINELSALSSGILLFVLGLFPAIKLIHFSFFLIAVLVLYIYMTYRLYHQYKISLNKSLEKLKQGVITSKSGGTDFRAFFDEQTNCTFPDKYIFLLDIIKSIDYVYFEQLIQQNVQNEFPQIRHYILQQIEEYKIFSCVKQLNQMIEREKHASLKNEAIIINKQLHEFYEKKYEYSEISDLVNSYNVDARELAARIIGTHLNRGYANFIIILIRDINRKVVSVAIDSASKLKEIDFTLSLIDYLDKNIFYAQAAGALIERGEKSILMLEQMFYKTGISDKVLKRVVYIMGLIGGQQAIKYLTTKINHQNREIAFQTLLSLQRCNYIATGDVIHQVKHEIQECAGIITWNLAAIKTINESKLSRDLLKAFNEEIESNYDTLFLLLSLIYDSVSIHHVRENLEIGSTEGIGYALELLDLVMEEDLKPYIFPILEDTPISEKLKALQDYYSISKYAPIDLLYHIINRNYNQLNIWTKTVALKKLSRTTGFKIGDDIIALLFNPATILHQTAAMVIHQHAPEVLRQCGTRIDKKIYNQILKDIVLLKTSDRHLLIEKIKFLQNIDSFKKIPANLLIELAENFETENFDDGFTLPASKESNENHVYFIIEGEIDLIRNNEVIMKYHANDICGEIMKLHSDGKSSRFVTSKHTHTYKLNRDILNEIIFNHHEIAKSITSQIDRRFTSEYIGK